MENNFLLTEDMLWDYVDGFLRPEEKQQVDAYLAQHPEQQARLHAITGEKQALALLPRESPEAGFSARVLAAWAAEQAAVPHSVATDKGKDWIIYSIAIAMGAFVLLAILLLVFFAPVSGANLVPVEYVPPFPALPWEKMLTSPVTRFATPLLLLFGFFRFLDQYLQQKKRLAKLGVYES